jgi:hypothetical protein
MDTEEKPSRQVLPPHCRVCLFCRPGGGSGCEAFPSGIPGRILEGEVLHRESFPGDHGICFRKRYPGHSFFLAEGEPHGIIFRITTAGAAERYVPIFDVWEEDDSFVHLIVCGTIGYRPVPDPDVAAFIGEARDRVAATNPCSLDLMRALYRGGR